MSDDEAYERLKAIRFQENGGKPFCPDPACAHPESYEIKTRRIFKCAACRKQFSVTSGTAFASRKLPIKKLLYAAGVFANGVSGVAALRLRREVGLSYKTAFVLEHKLREALALSRTDRTLSGEVEADGCSFDKKVRHANLKKHRKTDKGPKRFTQVVVAARERGLGGESRVTVVPETEDKGVPFLLKTIAPGSHIFTDNGPWSRLGVLGPHQTVNHTDKVVGGFKIDGIHTNGVESLFTRVRRNGRGVHYRVRGENLDLYAQETSWREDFRGKDNGAQWAMILHAATHAPISRRWKGYWQRWQQAGVYRRQRFWRPDEPLSVTIVVESTILTAA